LASQVATYGKDEKCLQNFLGESEWKNHSEDLGVDGNLILDWILRK